MKVVLEDHTSDPEYRIGLAASECYDSKTDRVACIKRANHCVENSHLATLRFAYASMRVEGISRVCSHQLVRMSHAGLLQRSQRYVAESEIEYVNPPALEGIYENNRIEWLQIQKRAERLYLMLIDTGQMKKEDARYILPQACTTSIRMCLNFQAWIDFLNNRDSKHAQWEIREVAKAVRGHLMTIAPSIFKVKNDT